MKNNLKIIIKIILLLLAIIIIEFFQFDITTIISECYNWLVSGLFYYLIIGIKFIVIIMLIILSVKYVKRMYRKSKFVAVILITVVSIVFMVQYIFPLTVMYDQFEYKFNQDVREQVVLMFKTEDLSQLTQTDENTYVLPWKLRTASRNAKVEIERNENTLKILFCAHKGIVKNSDVIYVSDMSGVCYEDFYREYDNIIQIDNGWYLAQY